MTADLQARKAACAPAESDSGARVAGILAATTGWVGMPPVLFRCGVLAAMLLLIGTSLPLLESVAVARQAEKKDDAKKQDAAAKRQYNAAAALQKSGEYETAAEEWSKFLEKYSQHELADRAQHFLGICQLQAKQYDLAQEAFQKVVANYPQSTMLSSAYLHLGMSRFNLARGGKPELYDQAIAAFTALESKFAESKEVPRGLLYHGDCLYDQGKKAEAVALYQQIVSKYAQDAVLPDALYALGVTQEELDQHDAASATYATFLKQHSKDAKAAEVGMRRGEVLLALKRVDDAEQLFAWAAAHEDFALADQATMRQAYCHFERQAYDKAAALYATIPTRFAKSKLVSQALLWAGKSNFMAGKFAQARGTLAKVLEADETLLPEASHWLAKTHLKENHAAEALQVVEAALPKAGKSPYLVPLQMDRADSMYEIPQRRGEATDLYASLAESHPDDPLAADARYMAGFCALGQKDYEAALAQSKKFLDKYPEHRLSADVIFVAAESSRLLTRYGEAGPLYAELLKRFANSPDVETWKVRLGLCLFLEKKYTEAMGALEAVAPTLRNKDLAAEAWYLVGRCQNATNQFEPAVRSLQTAYKTQPQWRQADETLLALSFALRQTGQLKQARQQLDELVKLFPQSRVLDRVHHALGEYADAAGDFATASAEYSLVVEKWPSSVLVPSALYNVALAQSSLGDHAAACATLDGWLQKYATHELAPRAHFARALARQQLQQFGPAVEDLQAFGATAASAQEKSDAAYVMGLCLVGLDKQAEAEAAFRKLLADDPQYKSRDKVLYELAWSLKSQEKQAEAAEVFGQLAKEFADSPKAAEGLYLVGEFQYQQKDFAAAARSYYDAMQKAGASELGEKAAHKLGFAFYRIPEYDKAQQTFAHQRKSFPKGALFADATFMEAESLFKQAKYAEAMALYQQVKNPTGKDFAVLALLHAGQSAGQLKQWSESLTLLEKAARDFPEADVLPEVLYETGWAQHNLGKLDDALKLYELVTEKTDTVVAARARFMVGEVYFEQKKHSEAVRNFFKADAYGFPEWQANAQYEAARCFEVLGKKEQARKAYQQVVDKHPQSDKAELAKKRLAELNG